MMHDGQRDVDAVTVRGLIERQFPQWAHERVVELPGSGTVNAIFRVGTQLTARFPLTGTDAATRAHLRAEASAMDEFAGCSPVAAPRPVAIGEPDADYDLPWSVQTWVDGEIATPSSVAASREFALDLAALIRALRACDVRGRRFAGSRRGGELADHDPWVATCIRQSAAMWDPARLTGLWKNMRSLPHLEPDVMTHGDLIPANVLVDEGRLVGVLDSGGFGPSDPALELVGAWHLLDRERREVLRGAIGAGDLQWRRGAVWAFVQAIGLVWYYGQTNPVMAELGTSTVERLLDDAAAA